MSPGRLKVGDQYLKIGTHFLRMGPLSGLLIERIIYDQFQTGHTNDSASWAVADFNGSLPGLLLISTYSERAGTFTATPNVPALTSDELEDITQIDTVIWAEGDELDSENALRGRLTLFTATLPAIVDGSIVRHWGGESQLFSAIHIVMVYGATGIVQSSVASGGLITDTLSTPLNAFADANNLAFAAIWKTSATPDPPLISLNTLPAPSQAYAIGEVLAPGFDWGGAGTVAKTGMIAVEIAR